MSLGKRNRSNSREAFGELDWKFEAVPDNELVACCYWEYARESAFIRDVKQRCIDPRLRTMNGEERFQLLGMDVERIQTLEYRAHVFLRGFFFNEAEDRKPRHPDAPPITGSFPKSWQSLSKAERSYRSKIDSDREQIPLVPFKRGYGFMAQTIVNALKNRQTKTQQFREEVLRQHPGVPESKLLEDGKLNFESNNIPSIFWVGGMEAGLFNIEWETFTNEELRDGFYQWVKANRPKVMSGPDGRGKKLITWRVSLERLGILRLLHRFTLEELRVQHPEAWKHYSTPSRRWQDDAKKARKWFRELLPFLDSGDEPLSWPPKGMA